MQRMAPGRKALLISIGVVLTALIGLRLALPSIVLRYVDRVFDAIVLLLLLFAAPLDPAFPRGATLYGQSVPVLARGGVVAVAALLAALSFLPPALDAASGAAARPLGRGVLAEPLGRAGTTVSPSPGYAFARA